MPADLLAEYEAPAQVQPNKAPDLMAEFDPPPREEQHAIINDAADKAHRFKTDLKIAMGEGVPSSKEEQTAAARRALSGIVDSFGEHFTEETKKTLTDNWERMNTPLLELPQAPEATDEEKERYPAQPIIAGAYNGAAKVLSGLTTPLNVGTLGAFGALSKIASGIGPAATAAKTGLRLIQTAFAAQMAKGAGEAAGAASVTAGKTTQEETADVVGALAGSAMALLAAHSASKTPEPSVKGKATNPNAIEDALGKKTDENLAAANADIAATPTRPVTDSAEPVNIGLRDETVSTGNGVPTPKETEMLAEQKRLVDQHLAKPNLADEFTPPEAGTEEHTAITEELAQPPVEVAQPEPAVTELPTVPPPEGVTGIRNAIVDEERKARGLEPAMEEAARGFGVVWQDAMKILNEDPTASSKLVEELNRKPRAITDTEDALLTHRQVDLQNQFDKVADSVLNGAEGQSAESLASDKIRLAQLSDELLEAYSADKSGGRETARGLSARRMLVNEDFSLAKMITRKRAVNPDKPLTEKQLSEVAELHKKIESTQKAFDDYKAANKPRAGTSNRDKNIVSTFIDKQADAARTRIKERAKAGLVYSGLPLDALADYAIIGAQHIKNGAEAFADWSKKMTEEFGEKIKPHLQAIFDKATIEADDALLNSRIEARKQRLEETIAELTKKIATGDTSAEPTKASRPSVEEIEVLEQQRDNLRDDLNAMRKTEAKITELQEAIEEKERKIAEGDLSAKPTAASRPSEPAIEKLKQERDALNKDLASARKEERKPDEAELQARKLEELNKRIKEKKDALKSGDVTPARKELNRPQPQELEEARQELESLNKQLAERRTKEPVVGGIKKTAEEIRLQSFKTRAANRAKEYEARLAGKEKVEPSPLKLDPEAEKLKAAADRAKGEFQAALIEDRLANRTNVEKSEDVLVKWRRGFLLSGYKTLFKLQAAAVLRMASSPLEEGAGTIVSKALPGLSEGSPRHGGGLNVEAEAAALSGAFFRGLSDAAQTLKTGHSDLEILYGKRAGGNVRESDIVPRSVIDFFGSLHGALKAPVKRAEFERSFEKRVAFNIRNGIDVTDPMVQTRIAVEAYKDANRAIFMQDNLFTEKIWNPTITRLMQRDAKTGEVSAAARATATALRVFLPIVKVPTNIVAETMEYSLGVPLGATKYAWQKVFRDGIEKLTDEQRDVISRQLKKGLVGSAFLAYGYFNPDQFGGYYQPGDKRKMGDVKAGNVRVNGTDIPSYLLHHPLIEQFQIGATIRRVADAKVKGHKNGIATGTWAAALGLVEELPFIRTQIELAHLFGRPDEAAKVEGNLARGLVVPQGVQDLAAQTDRDAQGNPIRRNPKTVLENIKTGIPVLREDVRRKN